MRTFRRCLNCIPKLLWPRCQVFRKEKDKEEEHLRGALCSGTGQHDCFCRVRWDIVTRFIFSFFIFFIFSFVFWSSWTFLGKMGFKITLCPWKLKDILLVWPSYKTYLSYCQGLPNRICVASIGTTSHKISSLYFSIAKVMRRFHLRHYTIVVYRALYEI